MTNNQAFEQLIISSILGDGSFTKKGASKYSRLSVAHGVAQKALITMKQSILEKQGLANTVCYNKMYNSRYKQGFIEEFRFKSKSAKVFSLIRDKCYDNTGHKRVVPRFIRGINQLGLALWFMDDGNVTNNSFQLNTQSFTIKEVAYLIRLLKKKFNINCTRHTQGQIYILAESRDRFAKLVKPYMLSDLEYKLVPYDYRVLNKEEELQER